MSLTDTKLLERSKHKHTTKVVRACGCTVLYPLPNYLAVCVIRAAFVILGKYVSRILFIENAYLSIFVVFFAPST